MGFDVFRTAVTSISAMCCLSVFIYMIYVIYELKFSKLQIIFYLLASGLVMGILSELLANPYHKSIKTVSSILVLMIFTYFILKCKLARSIVLAGLYTIILAFTVAVTSLIFSFLNMKITDYPNFIYAHLMVLFLHFFIAFILTYFKTYIVLPKEVKGRASRKAIVNLLFVLAILITNFSYYSLGYKVEKPQLFLNVILIMSYFLFSILNINTTFQLESKRQELEYQIFYNNTLESVMTNLRRFKHNYNNMLAVINGYVMVKRWDELKSYMSEIVHEEKRESAFNSLMLLKIKNAGLFGLITNKLQYAIDKNVDLNVLIEDEISEVGIKISDLCEIMGILLDNAIEASSETEEKLVRLIIKRIDKSISFSIENSVVEIPDIKRIYEKSYSTKGEGRGMGLWFLNNIIRKNKNVMLNTLTKEKRFKQDLIVS